METQVRPNLETDRREIPFLMVFQTSNAPIENGRPFFAHVPFNPETPIIPQLLPTAPENETIEYMDKSFSIIW